MPARDSGMMDPSLTERCRWLCMAIGCDSLSASILVFWNRRMRTAAGRAFWPAKIIELNPVLSQFPAEETDRTLKHELAHLIAYERAGRRRIAPHGAEWVRACAELGIPGERACHTLPLKRRRLERRHAYVCTQCFAVLHRVRPLKRAVACAPCCRKFNNGHYDARFRLIAIKKPPAPH